MLWNDCPSKYMKPFMVIIPKLRLWIDIRKNINFSKKHHLSQQLKKKASYPTNLPTMYPTNLPTIFLHCIWIIICFKPSNDLNVVVMEFTTFHPFFMLRGPMCNIYTRSYPIIKSKYLNNALRKPYAILGFGTIVVYIILKYYVKGL